jgi:hypothetical protein
MLQLIDTLHTVGRVRAVVGFRRFVELKIKNSRCRMCPAAKKKGNETGANAIPTPQIQQQVQFDTYIVRPGMPAGKARGAALESFGDGARLLKRRWRIKLWRDRKLSHPDRCAGGVDDLECHSPAQL